MARSQYSGFFLRLGILLFYKARFFLLLIWLYGNKFQQSFTLQFTFPFTTFYNNFGRENRERKKLGDKIVAKIGKKRGSLKMNPATSDTKPAVPRTCLASSTGSSYWSSQAPWTDTPTSMPHSPWTIPPFNVNDWDGERLRRQALVVCHGAGRGFRTPL